MKVLYFHQYFCTPEGNSGIRSFEMARYLVDHGHRVTMVFGESPRLRSPLWGEPYKKGERRGNYEGIDLIELNVTYNNKMSVFSRTMAFIKFSLRSIRLVFTEDYDIVFATTTPITAGIPAIVMKICGKKKPFVFEVRDLWPELPREMGIIKNRLLLWAMGVLEFVSYNRADACVALSPGIKMGIEKRLKKTKPVHLIPNGCDLDLFTPGKHSKSIIPGCSEKDFIAVFIGAHGIANGLDAALNAGAILNRENRHSHIKIVLIGDGKMKSHLAERVKAEKLENVIMLDPVPKKDLMNYLHAADVGLMLLANVPAFYFGTSPNKFFDYISSGLPVLNNYPGWLAEMIAEHDLGKIVQPDLAEEFAEALVQMSSDAGRLDEMGKNARVFAEKQFDRKRLAHELEQVLGDTYNIFNAD